MISFFKFSLEMKNIRGIKQIALIFISASLALFKMCNTSALNRRAQLASYRETLSQYTDEYFDHLVAEIEVLLNQYREIKNNSQGALISDTIAESSKKLEECLMLDRKAIKKGLEDLINDINTLDTGIETHCEEPSKCSEKHLKSIEQQTGISLSDITRQFNAKLRKDAVARVHIQTLKEFIDRTSKKPKSNILFESPSTYQTESM